MVGDAQLPTPAARYSWARDEPSPAVHVGEGSLHLNIAQVRQRVTAVCHRLGLCHGRWNKQL